MMRVSPTKDLGRETSNAPAVLTVPEACATLRISRWTLYELIHSRQLTTIKIGSRRLVPATAVRQLVERLQAEEAA